MVRKNILCVPEAELDTALQRSRPWLLRQTRAFGIIDEQAEDVVQETLIAAWKAASASRS
ncbi:sigma-70-like protein [Thermosporothrix hazakensis]|jgi:DNA-directed RNA polymerase specialized sigma24 family protein|uniref:Sigma-70-like protein n=1 Tax=Thermosporothrix hazakensis TaxID=644383 RepID=A0A326UDS4_THEHA|nr:sigma factor [Thermosporothrix hazakensis]PZW36577.1 sigma-70-like protein [Thermosporothrix hazakensis]GCE47228.1 hypothetical protein KTH_20970 [Thermosporothrix hazakensis]